MFFCVKQNPFSNFTKLYYLKALDIYVMLFCKKESLKSDLYDDISFIFDS